MISRKRRTSQRRSYQKWKKILQGREEIRGPSQLFIKKKTKKKTKKQDTLKKMANVVNGFTMTEKLLQAIFSLLELTSSPLELTSSKGQGL